MEPPPVRPARSADSYRSADEMPSPEDSTFDSVRQVFRKYHYVPSQNRSTRDLHALLSLEKRLAISGPQMIPNVIPRDSIAHPFEQATQQLLHSKIEQARLNAEKGDWLAVRAITTQMAAKYPQNLELLELKITAHYALQQWPEALKTCQQVIPIDPSHGSAFMKECQTRIASQAHLFYQANLFNPAGKLYQMLADHFPENGDVLERLAACFYSAKDWEGVAICYAKKRVAGLTIDVDEAKRVLDACREMLKAEQKNPVIGPLSFDVTMLLRTLTRASGAR